MRRFAIPLAPVLIAAILGPLAETELRRALAVSQGDLAILVSSPITVSLYTVMLVAIVISFIQHRKHRREKERV
jgi:putative tricarboxylic transport membrane protein